MPIYNVPSDVEQFIANQCFFGRNLELPPLKGNIRFLNLFTEIQDEPLPAWVSNTLYSSDKSLSEWQALIKDYKQQVLAFPFLQRGIEMLETFVMKHLQIRMRVRKFVRNIHMKIASRRVIGEVDLYTTTAIPRRSQVRVFDIYSKSVYVFHTHTAVRIILSGLQHSIYGIPTPHMPKNPYTNVPFHYTQLMTIMEQICVNYARMHRTPPHRLFNFRKTNYNVEVFKVTYRHYLNLESARALLLSFHDPSSIEFYMEVLDDTVEIEDLIVPRWNIIRNYVRNRTLPQEILKRFDTVALCLFLYLNHSLCYIFKSYDAMLVEMELVCKAALQWWKHTPRKIVQRIGHVAFNNGTASAPQSNSQILEHV